MIRNVKIVATPDSHKHLPIRDHTTYSNINTCPKWGVIRYVKSLVMSGAGRAMALEAGETAHEAFAALRLYQFLHHSEHPSREEVVDHVGREILGEDRYDQVMGPVEGRPASRTDAISVALEAHYSSGFFDDPQDKRRTSANISDSIVAYVDAWNMDRWPVWYSDDTPTCQVGIERSFDMLITFDMEIDGKDQQFEIRYCGKIDGIHWDRDNRMEVVPHENKTGARIDDAWLAQWLLSHQITGYCVASEVLTGERAEKCHVLGLRIPPGRELALREETTKRATRSIEDFIRWIAHSETAVRAFENDPLTAAMYTHSCNRYFRACSLVPLCTADHGEQKRILDEMEIKEWSPLETKVVG